MSTPEDLTPRVAKAEGDIVSLQSDTTSLQSSDKDIANRLVSLENSGDLTARVLKIENDIVALNATVSELKTARDDALARLQKLEGNSTPTFSNVGTTIFPNASANASAIPANVLGGDAPIHSFQDENASTDAPVHSF